MTTGAEPRPARSASSNLTWWTVANVAVPISAFVTSPILARALGPHGRGEAAAVVAPIAFVTLFLTFGIPESLTYHVATRRIRVDAAVRLGLVLGAASGVVAAGVIAALTPVILDRYPAVQGVSYALALTLPVIMGFQTWRYVAQGMGRFDLANRERWLWIGTRLVLLAGFAAAGVLGVTLAAWITHGTAVIATVMLFPVAAGAFRHPRTRRLREDFAPIVRYGLRSWTGTLGYLLLLRVDQVLIAPLGGARVLGIYAVAAGAAELPNTALTAVRDVMFATSAQRSDPLLAARAARAVVAVLTPICLAAVLVAPVAVPLLFGDSFSDAVPVTQLLFLAAVPGGIDLVLGAGLLAGGRPGLRSLAGASAAALLVVALVVLVPSHGALGGAIGVLLARLAGAVITVAATARTTGVSPWACFVPTPADARYLVDGVRSALGRLRG